MQDYIVLFHGKIAQYLITNCFLYFPFLLRQVAGMFLDKSIGKKKVVFIVNQIGTLDYKDVRQWTTHYSTVYSISARQRYMTSQRLKDFQRFQDPVL